MALTILIAQIALADPTAPTTPTALTLPDSLLELSLPMVEIVTSAIQTSLILLTLKTLPAPIEPILPQVPTTLTPLTEQT